MLSALDASFDADLTGGIAGVQKPIFLKNDPFLGDVRLDTHFTPPLSPREVRRLADANNNNSPRAARPALRCSATISVKPAPVITSEKQLNCVFCDLVVPESQFWRHLNTCLNYLLLKCNSCNKRFASYQEAEAHVVCDHKVIANAMNSRLESIREFVRHGTYLVHDGLLDSQALKVTVRQMLSAYRIEFANKPADNRPIVSVVQRPAAPIIQTIVIPQLIASKRQQANNGFAASAVGFDADDVSIDVVAKAQAQQNVVAMLKNVVAAQQNVAPVQGPATQRYWITGAGVGGLFPKAPIATRISASVPVRRPTGAMTDSKSSAMKLLQTESQSTLNRQPPPDSNESPSPCEDSTQSNGTGADLMQFDSGIFEDTESPEKPKKSALKLPIKRQPIEAREPKQKRIRFEVVDRELEFLTVVSCDTQPKKLQKNQPPPQPLPSEMLCYLCPTEKRAKVTSKLVWKHINNHLSQEFTLYKCLHCNYGIRSLKAIQLHLQNEHKRRRDGKFTVGEDYVVSGDQKKQSRAVCYKCFPEYAKRLLGEDEGNDGNDAATSGAP